MTHPLSASVDQTSELRSREAGFSLLEALIAAVLLLVITVGILPLFNRAMRNNVHGNDSTRQSNAAIDTFETTSKVPFNSTILAVPAGETELVVNDVLALRQVTSPTGGVDQILSNTWIPAASLGAGDQARVSRQRRIQYFSFDDFLDNQLLENPLDGGVEARLVHFKVVDVTIQDLTGAERRPYVLRTIQAY